MSNAFVSSLLNFVGWDTQVEETEEEEMDTKLETTTTTRNEVSPFTARKQQNKVVSLPGANSQFKVVVLQPEKFEDAQDICDHLKSNKPIVVNLEGLEKESAKKILDFLSGAVYALDGTIQKVSVNIFLIAPVNVDVLGDFKDELKGKGVFPWVK